MQFDSLEFVRAGLGLLQSSVGRIEIAHHLTPAVPEVRGEILHGFQAHEIFHGD